MQNKIKYLIKLNIINYINNFLYSFVLSLKGVDGYLSLWSISPLIFLTLTSFILATDNKPEYKIFKKEALLDFIVRVIGCGVGFLNYRVKFLSYGFILRMSIIFLLMIINLFIEYRIYKKSKDYTLTEENKNVNNISFNFTQSSLNKGKAATIGLITFYVYTASVLSMVLITPSIQNYNIFTIPLFVIFICFNYLKLDLYFADKIAMMKRFYKDSFFALIGFLINFIVSFNVVDNNNSVKNLCVLIGVLTLYPTIKTNREIAKEYRKEVNNN